LTQSSRDAPHGGETAASFGGRFGITEPFNPFEMAVPLATVMKVLDSFTPYVAQYNG